MQVKSIVIGGSSLLLLLLLFASCLPKPVAKKKLKSPTAEQAQQVQEEPKLTTLKCVYSGQISSQETGGKQVNNEEVQFQFDREKSTITQIGNGGMQTSNASVSPDLILFKTVESRTVSSQYSLYSLTVSNFQINRKTLQFDNWGESKWTRDETPYMTWKYQGYCEKIIPNLEGNKI